MVAVETDFMEYLRILLP